MSKFEPTILQGTPLAIARVSASRGSDMVANMLDGDRISRWSTAGPQRPGDELQIDLGTVRQVQGIETTLTGYVADFPRELTIELSQDGAAWTQAWAGSTAFLAYLAALNDPLNVPLRFAFESAQARYVRMRQSGRDDVYYWTITELKVTGR